MFKKFLLITLIISPNITFPTETDLKVKIAGVMQTLMKKVRDIIYSIITAYSIETAKIDLEVKVYEVEKTMQTVMDKTKKFSQQKKKEFIMLFAEAIKINCAIAISDMKDKIDGAITFRLSPYLEKPVKELQQKLKKAKEELIAFDESIKQQEVESFFYLMKEVVESEINSKVRIRNSLFLKFLSLRT